MPLQSPPPPVQITQAQAEMPLLPGSDPVILAVFQWALAHSPSLREVVRQLPAADRKARYRLVPDLDANYGNLRIQATGDLYHIDIGVSFLDWSRCGDALEPWVATALFLALETARHGKVRETGERGEAGVGDLRILNPKLFKIGERADRGQAGIPKTPRQHQCLRAMHLLEHNTLDAPSPQLLRIQRQGWTLGRRGRLVADNRLQPCAPEVLEQVQRGNARAGHGIGAVGQQHESQADRLARDACHDGCGRVRNETW